MKHDPLAKPTVKLDADTAGSILVFLADYHTYVMEAWRCGEMTHEDAMDACYMLGNTEGRCLYDGLTLEDLERIEAWEEEVDEWKSWHGGCIIGIPTENEPTDEEIEEVLAIDEDLEAFCREHDPNWDDD